MKDYDMKGVTKILERHTEIMRKVSSLHKFNFKHLQSQSMLIKNYEKLSKYNLSKHYAISQQILNKSHIIPKVSSSILQLDNALKSLNSPNLKLIKSLKVLETPSTQFKHILRSLLREEEVEHFEKIGIFPHPILLEELKKDESYSLDNITTDVDEWLLAIWPALKQKLILTINDCFRDEHLFVTYKDLLEAHDKKLFNLTDSGLAKIVERTMALAVPGGSKSKVGNNIRTFYKTVPLSKIGNRYDLAIYMFLAKHFTVKSDKFAGHQYLPNRNIISHGVKSGELVIFHSINCVLLSHWIINKTNTLHSHKYNNQTC